VSVNLHTHSKSLRLRSRGLACRITSGRVDIPLELGAIFNADARCDHFTDHGCATVKFQPTANRELAQQFSAHNHFAGFHTGYRYSVPPDRNMAAGQRDRALDPTLNVQRFGTTHLAFDKQRFPNVCFAVRKRGAGIWFVLVRARRRIVW